MEKGVREYPKTAENPYVSSLERLGEKDNESYIQIYKSEIQSLFGLQLQGIKVLGYFMSIAKNNSDILKLNRKDCKEYTGYKSNNSINLGLIELLKNGFIARTDIPNLFFLNPNIFFNGDRMIAIEQYLSEMASPTANDD